MTKIEIRRVKSIATVIFCLMWAVCLFFIIYGSVVGSFVSINGSTSDGSETSSSKKLRTDFSIATQLGFVVTAIYISFCFCFAYPSLNKI